jgi:hypothetical protein
MTYEEFLEKLDRNNPSFLEMKIAFKDNSFGVVIIEKKGRDLVEVVERCCSAHFYPVVDKKLGMVFGCRVHGPPRLALFEYHLNSEGKDHGYINPYESMDRYISEGYGWFISSMQPRSIVAGVDYRPDRFDKDVFMLFEVDHVERDYLGQVVRRKW